MSLGQSRSEMTVVKDRISPPARGCMERDSNLSHLTYCIHTERYRDPQLASHHIFSVSEFSFKPTYFFGREYPKSLNHTNCWKLAQVCPQTETREKAPFQRICWQMVILSRRKRRNCVKFFSASKSGFINAA